MQGGAGCARTREGLGILRARCAGRRQRRQAGSPTLASGSNGVSSLPVASPLAKFSQRSQAYRVAACRASNATAHARDLPQHRPDRAARPSLRRCWCLLVVVTPRCRCSESTLRCSGQRCVLSAVCLYCTLHGRVRGCVRSSGSMSAAHLSRSRALQSRYLIMLFTHRNPVDRSRSAVSPSGPAARCTSP